jgi:alpha-ketoglutarate-dependent taurine dioxygenase
MDPRDMWVVPVSVRDQQMHGGLPFPLVLECRSEPDLEATSEWLASRRDELIRQAADYGVVLFRGFPVFTAQDFDAFVAAFALPNFPYYESLSNAVRVNRTPRVFTANEAPPDVTIYLHHEMAQTPVYPSHLFFFCEQPATTGGATPVCRSDVLWEKLAARCPHFARDLETKGLRYSHVMPAENDATSGMGRSWQSTLRATTRSEAEHRLTELGYSWEWQPEGGLRATTPVLPAVRRLPDGRTVFFNQLIAASQGWKDERNEPSRAITYGDGTPLDRAGATEAARLADELAFDLPWRQADVALVDNFVAMHGRRTFTGTRKVLASLVASVS